MANNRRIYIEKKEDFTYTNETAMPEAVGGYDVGTTFSGATLEQLFNGLLYPYQEPSFTSFSISSQSTTLECGVVVSGGIRTFLWNTVNDSNIETNSVDIDDITNTVNLATALVNDGTEAIDIGANITKLTTNTVHQWRISADDINSNLITRTFTVRWYSPFYYGVGAQALTVTQIQALTKQVVGKSDKTYLFSPSNEVMYFAYPATYGNLTSILDANGFETIGDWTKRSETFTNNSPDYQGGTVTYNVYEFNNLTTQTNFNNTFKF